MAVFKETVVLVTGANSGLGFQTVKLLMQSTISYSIYLGCLIESEGKEAVTELVSELSSSRSKVQAIQIDLLNDSSIAECYDTIKREKGRLDVLINNAGIALNYTDEKMREGWAKTYDVNVCGTHILTHHMVPLLLASDAPRLVFITSGLSSLQNMARSYTPLNKAVPEGWPKPDLHPYRAYRSSKAALNMVMLEWHWMLREDGVKTWAVSPGILSTAITSEFVKMPGAPVPVHPSVGAKLVVDVVEGHRDGDVGKIVLQSGIQVL